MSELMVFDGNNVEVFELDGKVLFNPKDVGACLGISEITVRRHIQEMDVDEVIKLTNSDVHSMNFRKFNNAGENFITEEGVYTLIFKSRKPEAIKFQKWVTKEVLPSIRKTGGYVNNADLFINTYLPFADDTTKILFKSTLTVVKNQNEMIIKQQKEIEHKEDVIVGLVDTIDTAEKRQVLNRVVRHKGANYQDRWNELYKQFEMKYHCDVKRRMTTYNENNKPKMKSKVEYIDRVMNKIPELYELACKLYENDVDELVNVMYGVQ